MVDAQGGRPVYRQIADLLRAAIATGVLGPGEQVLSEHELAAEHGVARGTAREAILLLRNEGLIEAIHGLGCFVRQPEPIERARPDRLGHGWEIGRDPDDPPVDNDQSDAVADRLDPAWEELLMQFDTKQLGRARAPAPVSPEGVRRRHRPHLNRAKTPVSSESRRADSNR